MLFACDLLITVQIPALKAKGSEYFSVTFLFYFPCDLTSFQPTRGTGILFCLCWRLAPESKRAWGFFQSLHTVRAYFRVVFFLQCDVHSSQSCSLLLDCKSSYIKSKVLDCRVKLGKMRVRFYQFWSGSYGDSGHPAALGLA